MASSARSINLSRFDRFARVKGRNTKTGTHLNVFLRRLDGLIDLIFQLPGKGLGIFAFSVGQQDDEFFSTKTACQGTFSALRRNRSPTFARTWSPA